MGVRFRGMGTSKALWGQLLMVVREDGAMFAGFNFSYDLAESYESLAGIGIGVWPEDGAFWFSGHVGAPLR